MRQAEGPPLRVLHLCPDPQRLTELFALYQDALNEPPFESTLVFLRGAPDAALKASFGDGVQFLDLSRRALAGLRLRPLWRLWRLLRGQRFDLIVAHRYKALALALALRRLGVARRVVGVVHGADQFAGWRRRLIIRARNSPVWLVAVSKAARDGLVDRLADFPATRVLALPNAVTDHAPLAAAVAGERLGLAPGLFWFGSIGRLVPMKGHAVLLKAFADLAASERAVGLALVGAGRLEAELKAQAARLGIADRVVFCGWRSDVRDLMSAFDVCVMPSLDEPFGLAVTEAMVAARPVIASRIGGISEQLGEVGLLVPPGDAAALTAAMQQLHADAARRDSMGAALRARWEREFSPPRFKARLRALALDTLRPSSAL